MAEFERRQIDGWALQFTDKEDYCLRQVAADAVPRGSALVTPGAWPRTAQIDVRRTSGPAFTDSPAALTVHAGTAAVAVRVLTSRR